MPKGLIKNNKFIIFKFYLTRSVKNVLNINTNNNFLTSIDVFDHFDKIYLSKKFVEFTATFFFILKPNLETLVFISFTIFF